MLAMLVAAGIGLVGTSSGAIAAPVNGVVIAQGADVSNGVQQVQHRRWRSRRYVHSRWRSRRHWRRGSRGGRCHFPGVSVWVPC